MAWNWSHTQQAYDNAYKNLSELPNDDLIIIWSEIKSYNLNEYNLISFDEDLYNEKIKECKQIINNLSGNMEPIIDDIWQFASEELRTCDNGGFNAWLCPYGCHTVSFDYKGE